ncbi:hypothetical protein CSW58_09970 [Caulobacter sp. B11]|uniref:NlpC/P60 family protein n=1 Tax=Caulobacter sp. B11 TaxID=2048899 RepID=UPI000C12D989|nr:NlpC/P60 family protein [Caulobacter sp. B11]PHY12818.1 hypothetical protein CSW58_09970 [Caulobacter sp. B11]
MQTNPVRFARSGAEPWSLWVTRYLPIPFLERGRSFRGCDCRGLALLILEHQCGIVVPEPADLYATTDRRAGDQMAALVRAEAARWREVQGDYPIFSLLLFEVGGLPTHVALSLGGRRFIHTQKGCGVRVSDLDQAEVGEGRWGARVRGAYVYDN